MIDKSWDRVWKNYEGANIFGRFMYRMTKREFEKSFRMFIPKKSTSIIEIGCGSGVTLKIIRMLGYRKSIGIDPSENSMRLCKKLGFRLNRDVFQMDASRWKEKKDVVFSHGMLEHFSYDDMKGLAKEFARISKRFIIIVQPNPHALISYFIQKDEWEWERPYDANTYIKVFESLGFNCIYQSTINFREQYYLIFERAKGV